MSQPIPRQSLADKVYEHLKAQLAGRSLSLGDRLHARRIAEELGVSRTTVNKAVDRLIEAGWVKPDQGRHPVVIALPPQLKLHEAPTFEFANQTDSTYELLLDRILRGDLAPGVLIKERPLAMELGVNPATVRRAAEWLRNDGFLERLPRRGWQVSLLTARDLKDAYHIRLLLEPLAISGAIHRISEKQLDELEEDAVRMIEFGEKATVYERRNSDYNFHKTLCEASGNRMLIESLEPLIRKVLLVTTVGFRYGRAERSFEEHRDVIRSIRNRGEKEAVNQIKNHLRKALRFNAEMWERGAGELH